MKRLIFMLPVAFALAGCTTTKTWSAVGGSRSDGVVRLSYQVGEFQKAQVSEDQAVRVATERCGRWGYTGAEAFGEEIRTCDQTGGLSGCQVARITKEYQCTGTGSAMEGRIIHPARDELSPRMPESQSATALPPGGAVSSAGGANIASTVLAAQRIASQQSCGDVRSSAGAGQFEADCADHVLVIDCVGAECRAVRAINKS